MKRHERELDCPPAAARAALARAAEAWGGEWTPAGEGGRLVLPVVYGLRRGVAVGAVEIAAAQAGSRVVWEPLEAHLELHRAAVATLVVAAVPALGALAWPFWPPLLAMAPAAALLGFAAWWLVVSRLRSSGPEEFLASIEDGRETARAAH